MRVNVERSCCQNEELVGLWEGKKNQLQCLCSKIKKKVGLIYQMAVEYI